MLVSQWAVPNERYFGLMSGFRIHAAVYIRPRPAVHSTLVYLVWKILILSIIFFFLHFGVIFKVYIIPGPTVHFPLISCVKITYCINNHFFLTFWNLFSCSLHYNLYQDQRYTSSLYIYLVWKLLILSTIYIYFFNILKVYLIAVYIIPCVKTTYFITNTDLFYILV